MDILYFERKIKLNLFKKNGKIIINRYHNLSILVQVLNLDDKYLL